MGLSPDAAGTLMRMVTVVARRWSRTSWRRSELFGP